MENLITSVILKHGQTSVILWSKGVLEDAVWEPPIFLRAIIQGSRAPKGELPQAQYPQRTITHLRTCQKNLFTFP